MIHVFSIKVFKVFEALFVSIEASFCEVCQEDDAEQGKDFTGFTTKFFFLEEVSESSTFTKIKTLKDDHDLFNDEILVQGEFFVIKVEDLVHDNGVVDLAVDLSKVWGDKDTARDFSKLVGAMFLEDLGEVFSDIAVCVDECLDLELLFILFLEVSFEPLFELLNAGSDESFDSFARLFEDAKVFELSMIINHDLRFFFNSSVGVRVEIRHLILGIQHLLVNNEGGVNFWELLVKFCKIYIRIGGAGVIDPANNLNNDFVIVINVVLDEILEGFDLKVGLEVQFIEEGGD